MSNTSTPASAKPTPEIIGSLLLMAATLLALVCANSGLQTLYNHWLAMPLRLGFGFLSLSKPLLLWINDGLMTLFFLSVGLEIKREFLFGELRRPEQILLPGVAALGGVLVPALIYVACNHGPAGFLPGWAIPTATDIAFALGLLALLGPRVPPALKSFVMVLAVLDDLVAVLIIALFYTESLSALSLLGAGGLILVLLGLNRAGVRRLPPYLLLGALLWLSVLKSGVHATLAGVVLALLMPMSDERGGNTVTPDPARGLMQRLHPWVSLGIVPLFAFANAGVNLGGMSLHRLAEPVTAGVALGLLLGKQAGIMAATALLVRSGHARLPARNWREFHGAALLCGIGFTMSLFISSLACDNGFEALEPAARLGILGGSLASAVAGYLLLRRALDQAPLAD